MGSLTIVRSINMAIVRQFPIAALALLIACSSSEETGAIRSADQPERTGPIVAEPLPGEAAFDSSQQQPANTGVRPPGARVGDPSVRRGRDTVVASTQRVSRSAEKRLPLIKPPDAMYTVQVGAFRRAPNALALQKVLKAELSDQPVFNMFATPEGLYRVTIGKFETLREASNYRNRILKEHPKRFDACWVTYIERSR